MGELILSESVLIEHTNSLKKRLEFQDEILSEYMTILKNVQESAIRDGEVHKVIEKLYEYVEEIYKCSKDQGEPIKDTTKAFIERIDEIDLEL